RILKPAARFQILLRRLILQLGGQNCRRAGDRWDQYEQNAEEHGFETVPSDHKLFLSLSRDDGLIEGAYCTFAGSPSSRRSIIHEARALGHKGWLRRFSSSCLFVRLCGWAFS